MPTPEILPGVRVTLAVLYAPRQRGGRGARRFFDVDAAQVLDRARHYAGAPNVRRVFLAYDCRRGNGGVVPMPGTWSWRRA